MPAPPAAQRGALRQVPLFAELSDAEADELWASAEQLTAAPGEVVIREGDAGASLLIILSGALEITKWDGNHEITLATRRAGEYIGEMSLIEQAPRSASARAVEPTRLAAIGADDFGLLLARRPQAATTLLRTMAGRLRSTEASLIQSDKLASLGTLAAGLAHELNNPAAAIQRSAGYLGEAFESWRARSAELGQLEFDAGERQALLALERGVADCILARQPDAAARKEESRLADRLEALGIADAWEIAPAMAGYGWSVERVDGLASTFRPAHLRPVLQWLGAGLGAQQLIEEIGVAAQAISAIVGAVRSYAYLDQAPVQDVDVVRSIEDTLTILNHKLKGGVEVVRGFEPQLPRIEAFAGELNQVWTNIIDNAVQAMQGKGRLSIGARHLGDEVEVRIADDGPGIAEGVAERVFEPFFTTKAQGAGTGLGLHIAHNIVVNRHRGRIGFESKPGHTEFRIVLPRRLREADTGPMG